jgi:hypothetical protein
MSQDPCGACVTKKKKKEKPQVSDFDTGLKWSGLA